MAKISTPTFDASQVKDQSKSLKSSSHLFRFKVHKTWSIFLLYYFATYGTAFYLIAYFLSIKTLGICFAIFVGLQCLRLIPGVRKVVQFCNYWILLWLYRINYIFTLTIYLGLSIVPFAAVVYTSNYYAGPEIAVGVGIVLCLVVFYVLYRRRNSDAKAFKSKAKTPEKKIKKRVAIIGGGVAGIVAAKECIQEGHDVVVYEYAGKPGGVWNSDDSRSKRTTGRTLSSSSRYNSFFGDFPMNPNVDANTYSGKLYPSHYSENDYREYLADYIKEFDIMDNFKFNTKVLGTEQKKKDQWLVTIENREGVKEIVEHDYVIVCTGLNHQTNGLDLSEDKVEKAVEMKHSATYRTNADYKDKKVVIIGMGESSSDLAAEIAEVAKEVHIIVRNPVLLLPRNTFGQKIAPDHKLSRLILTCPQFIRTAKLLSQTAMHGPFNWMASNLLGLKNVFGSTLSDDKEYDDNWSWGWWKLFYKLGYFHPNAKWGLTRGQVTKTAPIVKAYNKGKLHFHTTSVKNNYDSLIELEDGTRIDQVDAVVNATGYKPIFPFLPESYELHEIKDRYRMTFHPELSQMAFIGFCRGAVGSVMQAMEMQARWVALIIGEKRVLPQKDEMKVLVEKHKKQMIGKWPTKVTMIFANAIAREEVGCEPHLAEVFQKSIRSWYYLMVGPYCMSMYRFRGPNSKPETAHKVFQKGPELVWPLEFHLQHILEFSVACLARFWSSIPPFKSIRKTNIICRTVVTPFIDLEY